MSVEQNQVIAPPARSGYGRVIRERGTRRLLIGVAILAILWFTYSTIHLAMMNNVHWPVLATRAAGLSVVGLEDQDRPGFKRRYVAIEANHAWQIRRPDDDDGGDTSRPPEGSDAPGRKPGGKAADTSPEAPDRGNDPGATHHVARGEVVDVSEVLRNCPMVLGDSQFTDANVEERRELAPPPFDRTYWVVHIGLTGEGLSRFWQFSSQHEGERLAFILGNEIITCTKLPGTPPPYLFAFIHSLDVSPIWVKADADRLAAYINAHGSH